MGWVGTGCDARSEWVSFGVRVGSMESERETELIVLSTLGVDGLPCQCEPFIEPDLFPDLESFFAAERAPLDQAVDAAVGVAVCIASVVEPVCGRGGLEMAREKDVELADVCSRWTSSSRSKFSAMVRQKLKVSAGRRDRVFQVVYFGDHCQTNTMSLETKLGQEYTTNLRTRVSTNLPFRLTAMFNPST